jgi:hypothetical protein
MVGAQWVIKMLGLEHEIDEVGDSNQLRNEGVSKVNGLFQRKLEKLGIGSHRSGISGKQQRRGHHTCEGMRHLHDILLRALAQFLRFEQTKNQQFRSLRNDSAFLVTGKKVLPWTIPS